MIVVNLKAYDSVVGQNAIRIARTIEAVQSSHPEVEFIVCPQMVDLALVASSVSIPVFAQHVDNLRPGSRTGWTTPEAVRGAGAAGTLINHSEHRLTVADIEALVHRCREVGLRTIVCTNNLQVSRGCAAFGPDYVAVEPPELIGGDVSVTAADPEIVRGTVRAVEEIAPHVGVLCGAGVKKGEDVKAALQLGTRGVLLASGVARASDPEKALEELLSQL